MLAIALTTTMQQSNVDSSQTGRLPSRNHLDSLSRHDDPGMFGRMFPYLPPHTANAAALQALATAMRDSSACASSDNVTIPVGYAHLAQFIEHDISFDFTSVGERCRDPLGIENFRTPSLDLDSMYGGGPDCQSHLYARDARNGQRPGPRFLIGKTPQSLRDSGSSLAQASSDLPRNSEGVALIADHRNDEHPVLARLHLAWLKFHNTVVDQLAQEGTSSRDLFEQARKLVTWHYQWLVLYDFVERIAGRGIVDRILLEGRRHYRFNRVPFLPMEFSAAAFQFRHTMLRDARSPIGASRAWEDLFDFELPARTARCVYSRKLDPLLAASLHDLPEDGGDVALRVLQRGQLLGLPSGQDIAATMKIANPMSPAEIASGIDGSVAKRYGMHLDTPLWYYILKEAQQRGDAERLGPVGARIVAEVFVGLLQADPESFLNDQSSWKPTFAARRTGDFTMTDVLEFAGDVGSASEHVNMRVV